MSDVWMLYLFTRLDSLQTGLGFVTFMGGVAFVLAIAFIWSYIAVEIRREDRAPAYKQLRIYGTLAVLAWMAVGLLYLLTPSSKDMAVIVGGKVTLDAIRSPQAQEVGGLVLDVVREKLKDAGK